MILSFWDGLFSGALAVKLPGSTYQNRIKASFPWCICYKRPFFARDLPPKNLGLFSGVGRQISSLSNLHKTIWNGNISTQPTLQNSPDSPDFMFQEPGLQITMDVVTVDINISPKSTWAVVNAPRLVVLYWGWNTTQENSDYWINHEIRIPMKQPGFNGMS